MLVQERRNSIANALELRLSCTNPLIYQRKNTSTMIPVVTLVKLEGNKDD